MLYFYEENRVRRADEVGEGELRMGRTNEAERREFEKSVVYGDRCC